MLEMLKFEKVNKYYKSEGRILRALQGISFTLENEKILLVIGESGSGKSTLAMIASFLENPTEGKVVFKGKTIDGTIQKKSLWREVQLIFQDPGRTLNPKKSVEFLLVEPLINYSICSTAEMEKKIDYLMDLMSLERSLKRRKAEELSGGEKQRVAIARALSVLPTLLILDEPFSFIDPLTKAQLLSTLIDVRNKYKMAWIYITHDLKDVSPLIENVLVLYKGLIMEIGTIEILQNPYHPYTKFLLSPSIEKRSVIMESRGCPFSENCTFKKELCKFSIPELKSVNKRYVRCHWY